MNPLLEQHIGELKTAGYEIEVIPENPNDNGRVFLIFKKYPIPPSIWEHDFVELLIIAQPTYPNDKLDMFWVHPKILLPGGAMPNGGNVDESYLGRMWQRFSWHPQKWNPGRDNLITYLEVVNHRLHQRR